MMRTFTFPNIANAYMLLEFNLKEHGVLTPYLKMSK
jgi:hypothetical protein